MTRVAILADIHGNLPALQAVQVDIERLAPDQVVVNGDIINRGPQSLACLAAVRATGWPVVFGNHEAYALMRIDGDVADEWRTPFWLPFQEVAQALSADEVAYIRALPHEYVLRLPDLPAIRCMHGSMRALNDGIGFWMSDAELLEAIASAPEPVFVGAHTHRKFQHRVGEHWILNCGAVGAPFNGDPGAQYLLMTAQNGVWQAEFRSIEYDRTAVYAAWEASGMLEKSMSAQVFKLEVETATYHLGTYIRFCELHGLECNARAAFERYRSEAAYVRAGRSLKV